MQRLIVAITGASGVIYGIRALEALRGVSGVETHLILTPSGARTIIEETDYSVDKVRKLAHQRAATTRTSAHRSRADHTRPKVC